MRTTENILLTPHHQAKKHQVTSTVQKDYIKYGKRLPLKHSAKEKAKKLRMDIEGKTSGQPTSTLNTKYH